MADVPLSLLLRPLRRSGHESAAGRFELVEHEIEVGGRAVVRVGHVDGLGVRVELDASVERCRRARESVPDVEGLAGCRGPCATTRS